MDYIKRNLWYIDAIGETQALHEDDIVKSFRSIVVLGEPGMGKSSLLQKLSTAAGAQLCTARQLINRHDPTTLLGENSLLIIDALDEVASKADGHAVDLVIQKLGQLNYPDFILSCRVADWQSATSKSAFEEQYGNALLEAHLEPLTQEEQLSLLAAQVGGTRANELLNHFSSYGLDFLGNPTTLELIARLPDDAPLPSRFSEVIESAVAVLASETNTKKASNALPVSKILDGAGAAFAALILTGSSSLVRGNSNIEEGEISIKEAQLLDKSFTPEILDTRLFSAKADSFSYWHRVIGEYLAAKWLAKRADTAGKRKRLLHLFHSEGLVPASLRGLHAWLGADHRLAQSVIAADPVGVVEYGDIEAFGNYEAKLVLQGLVKATELDPWLKISSQTRAANLLRPSLSPKVCELLLDSETSNRLKLFLLDQFHKSEVIVRYQNTLLAQFFDHDEAFNVRVRAAEILISISGNDWRAHLRQLLSQGSRKAFQLAYEILVLLNFDVLEDEEIVEVILGYTQVSFRPLPRDAGSRTIVTLSRSADMLGEDRLFSFLNKLAEYSEELLTHDINSNARAVVDLTHALALRYFQSHPFSAELTLRWLEPCTEAHINNTRAQKELSKWFRNHDCERRAMQRELLIKPPPNDDETKTLNQATWRLHNLQSGLYPDEDDVCDLLGYLDPTNHQDERWKAIIQMIEHDEDKGKAARDLAKQFASGNRQARKWISKLACPKISSWKRKKEKRKKKADRKRAARFVADRKEFSENIERLRAGEFRFIYPAAMAYLRQYGNVGLELQAHERITEWLGDDLAEAAHQGFEAFIQAKPVRITATRMSLTFANCREWPHGKILVCALAERIRKSDAPFDGLNDERCLAVLFELWRSRIDYNAGLESLLENVEQEVRKRGLWKKANQLYIIPQLKRQKQHVDGLYKLMRADEDADIAAELSIQWLQQCAELSLESELELIDRALQSRKQGELRSLLVNRKTVRQQEKHRRLCWDAVELLVDFDNADERLGEDIEPELIWHLQKRGGISRHGDSSPKLALRLSFWIVNKFRTLWPAQQRPDRTTTGDTNPWDASEFLSGQIHRIAADISDDAVELLESLKDAPRDGYTPLLLSVSAEQRTKRLENRYAPPQLDRILSIITGARPLDAVDLQALTLHGLETVQRWIRGNDVDYYRGFFRDDGRHKGEENCRDELIKMLRAIDGSLQYIPETHVADDKRVDIVVQASPEIIVPIEIKGQWHKDLWTAADQQLDRLYVNDWRAERGVYLVLWFGPKYHRNYRPNGSENPQSADELLSALNNASTATREGRVTNFVIDMMRPDS